MSTETLELKRPPLRAGGQSAVAITGVSKTFPRKRNVDLVAIEGLELEIASGEVLGIVGPSGCGKSTLLELIAGLSEPSTGSISVHGSTTPTQRTEQCVLMSQRDLLFPWRTALDNAALPLQLNGHSRSAAQAQALPLLERFGLAEFARSHPAELSGGKRQREAFARTLLTDKPVLLLDEPFGALDAITRASMQQWLASVLADAKRTTVLVSHDVEEALYCCDRVAIMSERPGNLRALFTVPTPRAQPRSQIVTSPDFVSLRQHALELLS